MSSARSLFSPSDLPNPKGITHCSFSENLGESPNKYNYMFLPAECHLQDQNSIRKGPQGHGSFMKVCELATVDLYIISNTLGCSNIKSGHQYQKAKYSFRLNQVDFLSLERYYKLRTQTTLLQIPFLIVIFFHSIIIAHSFHQSLLSIRSCSKFNRWRDRLVPD